jgi:VWFA-related protein
MLGHFIVVNTAISLCRPGLAALFLIMVCGLPWNAGAQQTVSGQEHAAQTQKTGLAPATGASAPGREGILRIDVSVTDSAGKPVTDLRAGDFALLDNGQSTRVRTFHSSTAPGGRFDAAAELIFVFDEVDMSPEQSAHTRQDLATYLRKQAVLDQPVQVYRLTHEGLFSTSHPSSDGSALADDVIKRNTPRPVWRAGSNYPDQSRLRGFYPLRALGTIAIDQRGVSARRAVLWLGTPAAVTASIGCGYNEVAELSTRLREARMTIYFAPMSWDDLNRLVNQSPMTGANSKGVGPAALDPFAIVAQNGGLIFNSVDELKSGIEHLAAEARAFYSLTFDPPHANQSDEYRNLTVAVSRPGVVVRTVAGYYNRPVYFDHPRPNIERVTVSQFETAIRRSAGTAELFQFLGRVELTERLTNDKRGQLMRLVQKDREREALMVAADLSEFLPLPEGEAPSDPIPNTATERDILKRAFAYLADSVPKLPDFMATRVTTSFQEPQSRGEDSCKPPSTGQVLRVAVTARGTVHYRDGIEVVEAEKSERKRLLFGREGALDTRGTFGPVLAFVLVAAAKNQSAVTWGRWERSEHGSLAVFHFVVPSTTPMFEVTYCCLPQGDGTRIYRNATGYHGEFAIDPSSGAVMRLAIEADLDEDQDPHAPLIRSALLIEYGAVEIGGKRYICPVRSVSISRGRTLRQRYGWGLIFFEYGPFETMVNDFEFREYHKFGSEARILPGFEAP